MIASRVARWPRVHARLHPVELGKDVVGQVERPVRKDVALDPAQDAERCERLVRRGDLLGLSSDIVCVEPGDDAHVARVIADREVLVAESARRFAHFQHARLSVRRRRVHVQVAADLPELDERRRRSAYGPSRSSGGTNGRPSAAKTPSSSGASGRAPRDSTNAAVPVARTSSLPNRSGGATTSSTGTPSTVTPSARSSPRSTTDTICGNVAKRSSDAGDEETTAK